MKKDVVKVAKMVEDVDMHGQGRGWWGINDLTLLIIMKREFTNQNGP